MHSFGSPFVFAAGRPSEVLSSLFEARVSEAQTAAATKRAVLQTDAVTVDAALECALAATAELREVRVSGCDAQKSLKLRISGHRRQQSRSATPASLSVHLSSWPARQRLVLQLQRSPSLPLSAAFSVCRLPHLRARQRCSEPEWRMLSSGGCSSPPYWPRTSTRHTASLRALSGLPCTCTRLRATTPGRLGGTWGRRPSAEHWRPHWLRVAQRRRRTR